MVFVTYEPSGNDNVVFSGVLELTEPLAGDTFSALSKELITTDNLLLGVRNIKMETSYKPFGISLALNSQFTLKTTLLSNIDKLTIGYIGISVSARHICSSCPGHHIFSG